MQCFQGFFLSIVCVKYCEILHVPIEKARNEFGIEDILLTNEPNNIPSRKMCEKLGAELTDIDEHCHYWIRK